ncbi:hypothetical protein B0H14DRAFT_2567903 [Mycena olivaceomarginata]|nr:hypothetical protein B0H14DRAFT_2570421 [Mycena olivaceomarginata]KAJ7877063.1 hypothetical protein B0H14DRAFT_2567903 [Mycena olivaceomarginata]
MSGLFQVPKPCELGNPEPGDEDDDDGAEPEAGPSKPAKRARPSKRTIATARHDNQPAPELVQEPGLAGGRSKRTITCTKKAIEAEETDEGNAGSGDGDTEDTSSEESDEFDSEDDYSD